MLHILVKGSRAWVSLDRSGLTLAANPDMKLPTPTAAITTLFMVTTDFSFQKEDIFEIDGWWTVRSGKRVAYLWSVKLPPNPVAPYLVFRVACDRTGYSYIQQSKTMDCMNIDNSSYYR